MPQFWDVIFYVCAVYLTVAVAVAIRLGWYMVTRLDHFDWHHSKPEIWGMFIFATLLWPLVATDPMALIKPADLFRGPYGMAERMREEELLRQHPPPCGRTVRYRQSPGRNVKTFGEFTFKSVDLEMALDATLREHPHLADDHEGAILNWLRQRDDSFKTPTDVPDAWHRFQFTADDELRARRGQTFCLQCNVQISDSGMREEDDRGIPGWNFDRLLCQHGHPLLVVESLHISVRQQTPG
ncbi:MAG: hypothetical protein NTX31_01270 [Burkholderiales bacterium]|nr:hypothetical protein [Burkholderiales bacterium]